MFGSSTLEVVIGLTFFYLLLSIICSGINEYLAAILKRRPAHLRDAITYLFNKDQPRGAKLLANFFEHPLIRGLAPSYFGRKFAQRPSTSSLDAHDEKGVAAELKQARKVVPNYISPDTFAKVVLDILARGRDLFASLPPDPASAGGAARPAGFVNLAEGDTTTVPTGLPSSVVAILNGVIAPLPDGPVKTALQPIVATQGATLSDPAAMATSATFWGRTAAAFEAIRTATAAFSADEKAKLDTVLAGAWQSLRGLRDHEMQVRRLRENLEFSLALFRGAVNQVPDENAKTAFQSLLDHEQQNFEAAVQVGQTLQPVWDALATSFQRVRGAVALLPQGEKTAALLGLVDGERKRLAGLNMSLISVGKIRDAVSELPDSELKHTLETLMNRPDLSLDEIEANISGWYNETMDRVSGWYKRNTQVILTLIALGVTVLLNADTLRIANSLIGDPALRAAVAAAARDRINIEEKQGAQAAAGGAMPSGLAAPDPKAPVPATADAEPMARIEKVRQQLAELRIPLGWEENDYARLQSVFDGKGFRGFSAHDVFNKLTGLILTTLALSLGAPFWYDVLNKVVNVRLTGKAPEK